MQETLLLHKQLLLKDTKNNTTWWCLTAPIKPSTEITIKIIPHASIPPIIGKFVTKDAALPYTATPIRMKATSWNTKTWVKLILFKML